MKSVKYIILCAILSIAGTGCTNWLEQEPMSNVTTGSYFKQASDFNAAANGLYGNLYGWATTFTSNEMFALFFDEGTDLNSLSNEELSGTKGVSTSDTYYTKAYKQLHYVNDLIAQCDKYNQTTGHEDISNAEGSAYFYRAWWHYLLLCRFGGVAIMDKVPDTESEIVWGPRSSRYQVVSFILSDLDKAASLVSATKASTSDNGNLTVEAVHAFKARVCLFEGTWEKYNGFGSADVTNGDGIASGAGVATPSDYPGSENLLKMAKEESGKFVSGGVYASEYSIFMGCEESAIADYQNSSYKYLFVLESSSSTPNGKSKSDNNEAIFRKCYDYATQFYSNMNLAHTNACSGTRKFADMFLCTDGLPINKSPLFKGYKGFDDEFQNRDARMVSLLKQTGHYYWCGNDESGAPADWTKAPGDDKTTNSKGCYVPSLLTYGSCGYGGRKYIGEESRSEYQCAFDYLHIRLAEMLLINAEASIELSGSISDEDLEKTVNILRDRGHIAHLTNALVNGNGLDMKEEIRRERAIELFGEGHRRNDLCRWGIAEQELTRPVCGMYVKYDGVETDIATSKNPVNPDKMIYDKTVWEDKGYITTEEQAQSTYTAGMPTVKAGSLISEMKNNRIFSKRDYLQPIPSDEIALNNNLKQNPNW